MTTYTGLLECEQSCIEACREARDFMSHNICVEECMVHCSIAKDKPANLAKRFDV